MEFDLKHIGYMMLVAGAILQVAEIMTKQTAALQNSTWNQTSLGTFVAPIEAVLPIQLGWSLIAVGATIVWVVPMLKK